MRLQSVLVILLMISALISFAIIIYALKRREVIGSKQFAILLLGEFIWAFGYIFEILMQDINAKIFWDNIQFTGIDVMCAGMIMFAICYSGYSIRYRKLLLMICVEPVINLAFIWYTPLNRFVRLTYEINSKGAFPVLSYEYGIWTWISFIYNYLLVFVSIGILLRHLIRSNYIYRLQIGMIIFGVMAPVVGTLMTVSGLVPINSMERLDITPISFSIANPIWMWGIFRYKLLNIVPVARNTLVEQMNICIIVLDYKKVVVDLNPMAQTTFKLQNKDVIGKPIFEVIPCFTELWKECNDHVSVYKEISRSFESGFLNYFYVNITPIKNSRGKSAGWLVSMHDITERKIIENEIKKLYKAIESSSVSVVITDKSGDIEYVNPKFTQTTGYTFKEIIGQNVEMLRANGIYMEHDEEMWKTILSGKQWTGEWCIVTKNGEYIWELASIAPVIDEKGDITHFVAIKEDITKQKAYEEALVQSNRRYSNLAANIPGMLYQLVKLDDESIEFLYISPACEKIFGVSPEEAKKDILNLMNVVHPDDLKRFKESMKISAQTLHPWHWTGRVTISGKTKWLQNDSIPEKQTDGSIVWDGIVVDITLQKNTENKIKVLNEELKHISFTDSLTGAFNRRKIIEIGQSEISFSIKNNSIFSICMVDIDHFKIVNDTYGHTAGDIVIKAVVDICRDCIRDKDSFGRFGGEEFLVILPETDSQNAVLVGERIKTTVFNTKIEFEEHVIQVTVSIGVASWKYNDNLDSLISHADQALYAAKNSGRNQVKEWELLH